MLKNNQKIILLPLIIISTFVFVYGCNSKKQLIVYTSVDQPFAEPVLAYYEKLTGVKVHAVYDTEAAKTVGLVNRLRAEANSPKADVFWSSEFAHTICLAREGIFSQYAPASATDIPAQFKDPQNLWTGTCLRARVLIVNNKLPSESWPSSIEDLLKPDWQKGQVTIAFPIFGTTNTHAAALFALYGKDNMLKFFKTLKAQKALIADSNGKVRDRVVNGQSLVGLTDTDDAMVAIKKGKPIKMIFPDQGKDQPGTLLIPNTVAIIKNCPHPENAMAFLDFITSKLGEQIVIKNSEGFFSIRAGCESQPDWVPKSGIKALPLTPQQIADSIASASMALKEVF